MYTQPQKEFLNYKIKTINVHFSHMLRKEPWELQSDMDNKVKELKNEKKKKNLNRKKHAIILQSVWQAFSADVTSINAVKNGTISTRNLRTFLFGL